MDALLYFSVLYPYYGVASETISGDSVSRQLQDAAYQRMEVEEPLQTVDSQILESRAAANVSPEISRGYYKLLRLMSHVYVVGGWTSTGPADTIERHIQ